MDEKDDVFAFDISDDIMHCNLKEPDTDNDSKSFEKTVIFQCSKITVSAAMVLILSFSVWFSLSYTAFSNLLLLINLFFLKDSSLCKTLHYFQKHFQYIKNLISCCHYCNNCNLKILDHSLQIWSKCRSELTVKDNRCFNEFPIINQLILFFKRPGFYKNLQYIFKHQKKFNYHIEDIWWVYL